ncbi:hypothetical protein H4Q26_009751 [Puccinia striiformis f. sp. tritici PST-130]|nr:hypothetical protein Pst134EB_020141 [Puccinia striiformis f. sp. tritici]KAI9613901.1 hypothetical protein H4Q26_009751 [Puccinia striiformis f. sp. tritici PST-130]
MKECFKTYKGKFKKAHTKLLSTGFGLMAADKKKGIKIIEAKLDYVCPLYAEMYDLVNQKPDVNPLCRVDAQDSEDISDSNNNDSSSSSKESGDNSDSVVIKPSLRDPKKIKQTQTGADLDGVILPGQSGLSEETRAFDREEQQSDHLPSGDEILNPKSKLVPKGNVVQAGPNSVTGPFLAFQEYTKKKKGGKSQQAGDVLGFEKMYDCLIAKGSKSIDLGDENFDHTKQMEDKKWDHSIQLEGKKWD